MTTIALHLVSESTDHYTYAIDLNKFSSIEEAVGHVKEHCFEFGYIAQHYSDYTQDDENSEAEHDAFETALKKALKQAWEDAE